VIQAGNAHSVEETTGYLLAKACRAHRGNVGALLSEVGLHVGQEMVLLELWKEDGLKGSELADRLGVEPPTVTRMIRRMERCGFVERHPDPADARSFRVRLTEKGRAFEEPVARIWKEAEERTLRGISPEDATILRRLLTQIRKNLRSAGAGC
jgi:MarR family transcriptional regulator, organic hydroperoxide resistance regulator